MTFYKSSGHLSSVVGARLVHQVVFSWSLLDHAWQWFSLHATQRLQSVNVFLVAIAFLSAAFVTAVKEQLHVVGCGISVLAVCVCFFFYRIERRIRSLVHAAENAMSPFEAGMAKTLGVESLNIVQSVETPRRGEWTYSTVFRWLYGTTAAAFAFGFIYVIWSTHRAMTSLIEFKIGVQLLAGVGLTFFGSETLSGLHGKPMPAAREAVRDWSALALELPLRQLGSQYL